MSRSPWTSPGGGGIGGDTGVALSLWSQRRRQGPRLRSAQRTLEARTQGRPCPAHTFGDKAGRGTCAPIPPCLGLPVPLQRWLWSQRARCVQVCHTEVTARGCPGSGRWRNSRRLHTTGPHGAACRPSGVHAGPFTGTRDITCHGEKTKLQNAKRYV